MAWAPGARIVALKLAWPPESDAVPRVVAPSLNVTVPVGVPLPGALTATLAVKVTGSFKPEGFTLELTVAEVEACTIWVSAAEVLPRKLTSPL
jgi:hypothetical protein